MTLSSYHLPADRDRDSPGCIGNLKAAQSPRATRRRPKIRQTSRQHPSRTVLTRTGPEGTGSLRLSLVLSLTRVWYGRGVEDGSGGSPALLPGRGCQVGGAGHVSVTEHSAGTTRQRPSRPGGPGGQRDRDLDDPGPGPFQKGLCALGL